MVKNQDKNIYLPCVEPLLDTWAVTKQGGDWEMTPPDDLSNTSVEERNTWYAETMMSTIEAFSPLARVYGISLNSIFDKNQEKKIKEEFIEWNLKEPYEKYLEKAFQAAKSYPVDIYNLYIRVDLFVYVRTKQSPDQPVRAWVRECGDHSYEMAEIEISIEPLMDYEPYLALVMLHTLFYPDSWKGHIDNTELFELNRPFLEEALRNWEQKFGVEIEPNGLPQIYKYGFLPD